MPDVRLSPPFRRSLVPGAALLLAFAAVACQRPPASEAKPVVGADGQVVRAQARGQAAAAHLTLGGAYKGDADAEAFCTLNPDKAFQVSFNVPGQPQMVLRVENFQGAGTYTGETRIRAIYSGETIHQSRGKAPATVTVVDGKPALISGSFRGDYKGEAGAGTVAGSFDRCPYEIAPPEVTEP
jgi:hypothetical protein